MSETTLKKMVVIFNNESFDYEVYVDDEFLDNFPTEHEGETQPWSKEDMLELILYKLGYDVRFKCSVF